MRKGRILAGFAVAAAVMVSRSAGAEESNPLVGTWTWGDFTLQAKECTTNPSGAGLCMTVIAGPKNIGLEMIRSKFENRPDGFAGKIAHPASGEIYNTKISMTGADVIHMDGCTDAGVCATGDFVRQK